LLPSVRTREFPIGGAPFGVVAAPDGRWLFVSEASGQIAVVADDGATLHVARRISLTTATPQGEALTPDGRYLLVAAGSGAAVINVARAEQGEASSILGTLSAGGDARLAGGIEVAVSRGGRFVFVSLEYANEIAVFDLHDALVHGFRGSNLVGMIPLEKGVVGIALSPSGRWLYATSELRNFSTLRGTVSVIDVHKAELQPRRSVVASVEAGCSPVRVAVSPDGATVWVTARASNSLLGFSAARLINHQPNALAADVRLGSAPVGLALLRNGSRIVVADSNRFATQGQQAALTVIDANAALSQKPSVLGSLPTGRFPRELSTVPSQQQLVATNFGSNQLEIVDTRQLP
jgi:DNA-binding beta-propeller fold protein YncE